MSSELFAISPVDGRYKKEVNDLSRFFSEFALIRERVNVEIRFLMFLLRLINRSVDPQLAKKLESVYKTFNIDAAIEVKKLEEKFDHDVKAIEVYLEKFVGDYSPYIHFGLTSEDVNNLAYGRLLTLFINEVYLSDLKKLIKELVKLAIRYVDSPMLGRTHGQPATPTTFGKEIGLYAYRLAKLLRTISQLRVSGKLNGAVGNFNALVAAYSKINWVEEVPRFIQELGLEPELFSTQILPYESYVDLFNNVAAVNALLINLCRDMWMYYSLGYISLSAQESQVGSSTMPHKVNPKDFENSEGNLKLANSLLHLYTNELLINRLQRDLSDSTIRRSFGVALAHSILAYRRLRRQLTRLSLNEEKMLEDLNSHGEVFSEALQIMMRKNGVKDAYFKVLSKVKGRAYSLKQIENLARTISSPETANQFENIIKQKYVGLAPQLCQMMVERTKRIINVI
ncbi:MAG: adenylosuccinate lyase [Thermoprotei archaeon]